MLIRPRHHDVDRRGISLEIGKVVPYRERQRLEYHPGADLNDRPDLAHLRVGDVTIVAGYGGFVKQDAERSVDKKVLVESPAGTEAGAEKT